MSKFSNSSNVGVKNNFNFNSNTNDEHNYQDTNVSNTYEEINTDFGANTKNMKTKDGNIKVTGSVIRENRDSDYKKEKINKNTNEENKKNIKNNKTNPFLIFILLLVLIILLILYLNRKKLKETFKD